MASAWIMNSAPQQQIDYGPGSFNSISSSALQSVQPQQRQAIMNTGAVYSSNPQGLGDATGPIGGSSAPRSTTPNGPQPGQNGYVNPNTTQGPSQADVDAAFAPEFSALDQIQSGLQSSRDSNLTTLQGQHDNQAGVIGGQVTGLQDNLAKNQLDWGNLSKSAYADALRAYTAMQQRSGAMYGGQSSAGQASNDIVNQAYLQNQGNLQNQDASAQLAFKGQDQDIQNWAADQHSKLDNWLLQAQQQVKDTFQQGVNAINADRGQTESAKSQAKLGLLQSLFQHQQQLQDYDNQLRMQVQLSAQGIPQGATYNTAPFQSQIGGYGQAVQSGTQNFAGTLNGAAAYSPTSASYAVGLPSTGKQYDQYGNLIQ